MTSLHPQVEKGGRWGGEVKPVLGKRAQDGERSHWVPSVQGSPHVKQSRKRGGRKGPTGLSFQGPVEKVSHKVGHLEEGAGKVRVYVCERALISQIQKSRWLKHLF